LLLHFCNPSASSVSPLRGYDPHAPVSKEDREAGKNQLVVQTSEKAVRMEPVGMKPTSKDEQKHRKVITSRSCIHTWLARYRSGGWGALKARALKGRPMKIHAIQMRWLYRTVTGKSPLQFRFEFALWTREMIRVLLREQFDLKLSVASVGRLLKQLGLSCQRPLFRAIEQDPRRVQRWRKQEYPPLRRQARAVGADMSR
jgi:transposase